MRLCPTTLTSGKSTGNLTLLIRHEGLSSQLFPPTESLSSMERQMTGSSPWTLRMRSGGRTSKLSASAKGKRNFARSHVNTKCKLLTSNRNSKKSRSNRHLSRIQTSFLTTSSSNRLRVCARAELNSCRALIPCMRSTRSCRKLKTKLTSLIFPWTMTLVSSSWATSMRMISKFKKALTWSTKNSNHCWIDA